MFPARRTLQSMLLWVSVSASLLLSIPDLHFFLPYYLPTTP